jgi:hypothetical protein
LAPGRPWSYEATRTLQELPKGLLGPESGLAIGVWRVGSYSSYKICKFRAIAIAPAEVGAEHRQGEVVTRPGGPIEEASLDEAADQRVQAGLVGQREAKVPYIDCSSLARHRGEYGLLSG